MNFLRVSLENVGDFDEIIDVRTPLEFADDHIPGAINVPVLSNEERVIVGTMYKQVSPFEASRVGAAMIARNIALHLDTTFADRPRHWRPLIYCWRGGSRSASMNVMMNMIGWRARQLEGGYKAYRRDVVASLDALPPTLQYIVLTGHTGSGKTRLLHALAQVGAQTLDLEALAMHRGSLLGAMPDAPQPSQKSFDTALVGVLRGFDPMRPVFVEAESRRIGLITLPESLMTSLRSSTVRVEVGVSLDERIDLLMQEYGHLLRSPEHFRAQLLRLLPLHGRAVIDEWLALLDAGRQRELSHALITRHYDPAYSRSARKMLPGVGTAIPFGFHPGAPDLRPQAQALLALTSRADRSGSAIAPQESSADR
ncbi:tRNA 2-selenouridine(34) synthase MnmH [Pandoraea apista]|uniref:tRNA 2-selenouridine synthase n=1 Tax=Pandoraea apista TaxID=93218 RepID=A0A5E5P9J8_9BURK|nr:tRNA 2-selenouridine(34) synthase MnmH [Pandoraea apista]OXS93845.1 tRNA 2-selenouridine(34) synthase MnmH [Pandoraea apista]VVG73227.1 tRNA 2-selenouridine synthase [Pandoraea apista]